MIADSPNVARHKATGRKCLTQAAKIASSANVTLTPIERVSTNIITGIIHTMCGKLEELYYNDFNFIHTRDYDDYIYLRTNLAELKGKSYQSKRNFVNRFKRNNNYEYLPITTAHIDECLALEAQWFETNNGVMDKSTSAERKALTYALQHFDELGLTGGLLRIGGRIVAFTFGMPINHDQNGGSQLFHLDE